MLVNITKFSASEVSLTGIIFAAEPLFVILYVPDNLADGTVPDDKLFALAAPENSLALTTDENVATPAIVTLSKFVCPSTSISPLNVENPVTFKLRVTISAPKLEVVPPLTTLIPLTKRLVPSNVKLLLSCNLPPAPIVTTLPDVKLATLVTPAILTLSKFV